MNKEVESAATLSSSRSSGAVFADKEQGELISTKVGQTDPVASPVNIPQKEATATYPTAIEADEDMKVDPPSLANSSIPMDTSDTNEENRQLPVVATPAEEVDQVTTPTNTSIGTVVLTTEARD